MMKQFMLTFLIFILGMMLFMSIRSCNSEKKAKVRANEMLEQALHNAHPAPLIPIKTTRDTVYMVDRQQYEPTMIAEDENLSAGVSPAYVDSISRALKISQEKITGLTKANLNLAAKIKLFQQQDTVTGRIWASFKDQTFDLKYYPDSNELDIQANVGLNFADYKDRKNIFQQWKYYTEAWTTDNRFKINSFNRVIREGPKRSRIGIDAYVGPVFTSQGVQYFSFGVGLGYRLIEF